MTYWWGWGNQVQYLVVGTDGKCDVLETLSFLAGQ